MVNTVKKTIQLLKFAWRANRLNMVEFGNKDTPIRLYFVRDDLVAFQFPLEAVNGTVEESLYILNNANLEHHKKRRAVTSIEEIDDTYVVDKKTFEAMFQMLSARIGLASGFIAAPTVSSRESDTTGENIIITFNKAMLQPFSTSEFSITLNGGTPFHPVAVGIQNPGTDTKYNLKLPILLPIKNGDTITVAYTRGSVLAADGGVLASFAASPVVDNTIVPEYVDAVTDVDGTSIEIEFSMAMDTPGVDAATDFTILVNGDDATGFSPETVTNHSTNTKILVLGIETGKEFISTDEILLNYVGESIKSTKNGKLKDLIRKEVENNVTAT